eukprot:4013374-Prymnesium_polylepis.1
MGAARRGEEREGRRREGRQGRRGGAKGGRGDGAGETASGVERSGAHACEGPVSFASERVWR